MLAAINICMIVPLKREVRIYIKCAAYCIYEYLNTKVIIPTLLNKTKMYELRPVRVFILNKTEATLYVIRHTANI